MMTRVRAEHAVYVSEVVGKDDSNARACVRACVTRVCRAVATSPYLAAADDDGIIVVIVIIVAAAAVVIVAVAVAKVCRFNMVDTREVVWYCLPAYKRLIRRYIFSRLDASRYTCPGRKSRAFWTPRQLHAMFDCTALVRVCAAGWLARGGRGVALAAQQPHKLSPHSAAQ